MTDIFISYARKDANFAKRLHNGIEANGISVWMDNDITAGEHYTDEIDSALITAAVVVVVVSSASKESEWVRREVLYAQQCGKRIVPVLAADISLPLLLIDLHALSMYGNFEAGFDQLISTLRETISTTANLLESSDKSNPSKSMAKLLWLFLVAAVAVVLAVIAVRGEGLFAEILATGLAIGGTLLAMAWKADEAISVQFKRDLGLWLDGLDPSTIGRTIQRWPAHFAEFFDRVFGKKHLSWRCFFRSSLASLLAFLLCTLIFIQAAPGDWKAFLEQFGIGAFTTLGITAMIANLLPDYVSLLETRFMIKRMQQSASVIGLLGWILVDFLATTAVFGFFLSVLIMSSFVIEIDLSFLNNLLMWTLRFPVADPELRFLAIPVWTTYFTTAWIWLYFLSQFLIRLVTPLRRTLGFLKYALPVKQKPLRAVGQVMALVACVGYCLAMLPVLSFGGSPLNETIEQKMVIVNPGQFLMGPNPGADFLDIEDIPEELPLHQVFIEQSFSMGKYEVTFEEYDRFAEATGRALPNAVGPSRGNRPVINVNWLDAQAYAEWLSDKGVDGLTCSLPSEAEWEYAARAGSYTNFSWGNWGERAHSFAWFKENSFYSTQPVGLKSPNGFGLFDMHGNVREWTKDCWHQNYDNAPNDGSAWLEESDGICEQRVIRGGSWGDPLILLRSSARYWHNIDYRHYRVGFRVLCRPPS